ncbi:MAG: MBG domain-containing protein [Bacillota bacterium]|nr:MBG domain-containing protein [Bacillota bacterium]
MIINRHSIAKKVIAILLTIAMVPTLAPSIAWADDGDGGGSPPPQEEHKDPAPAPAPAPEPEPQPAAPSESPEQTEEQTVEGETAAEEETEAIETEEEEDKRPAVSFSESAGGMAVKISAPEGALPEGATVKVSGISTSQAKSIAQRAVGDDGKIRDARGVDITFYDKDGKKIEPSKAVTVTLSGAGVRGNDPAIYHESSGGGVSKVKDISSGNGGTFSSSDFSVYVVAAEYYTVRFMMDESDGGMLLSQIVDLSEGDRISPMPDKPFKAGHRFLKWVDSQTGEEVNSNTVVTSDLTAIAVFEEVKVYELTVEYYYNNPKTSEKVVFLTKKEQIERRDAPIEIASPDSTTIEGSNDAYYPKVPVLKITAADLDDVVNVDDEGHGIFTREIQYVPNDTKYYFVYMLKNKDGNGYTEVDREERNGVLGSSVTPTVKNIKGGEFEKAQTQEITRQGQELEVFYKRAEYTLTFDTQGGDYLEPETAAYQTSVNISGKTPVRSGYVFTGWFKDPDCKQAAGTAVNLDSDMTLYAGWKETQVNYTVIYQIENADDDNYSYLTSQTKQAVVGSEVTVKAGDTAPAALDKNNFTFKEATKAVVKGDGSTVVTVKYSRNVYTIAWTGDVYNTSGKKRLSGQGSGSITAKYGAAITQQWVRAFNNPYPQYAWSLTLKNNDKIISIDTMPSKTDMTAVSGSTYRLVAFDFSTDKQQTLNYWLENYDGSTSVTRNGKTYGLYKTVTGRFNYLYDDADFYNIVGYTKDGYEAEYYTTSRWGGTTRYTYTLGKSTPSEDLNVDFYYAANTYPLAFYDYDGKLISTNQVKLNNDITSYLQSNKPESPVEGAVWLGWCTDSEHTDLYKGNKKMGTGMALYASWEMPVEKITFVDIQPDGTEQKLKTVKYNYGETAEPIAQPAAREGYIFQGWCTDKAGNIRYDFEKPMTEDVTVYARWKQATIGYTVRYVDQETGKDLAEPKTVSGPLYKKDDVIKEKASTFPGMLPDESMKEITLSLNNDDNVITFNYTKMKKEITYTVRYVLEEDENVEVAPPKTKTVSGDTVSVKESAVAVNKSYMDEEYADNEYHPTEEVIDHTFSAGSNVITFRYSAYRTTTFVINYLDMSGEPVKAEETHRARFGGSYRVKPDLDGYTFDRVEKNGTDMGGKLTYKATEPGTMELNVYFRKDLVITAKSLKKAYDGTALKSEGIGSTMLDVEGLASGHNLSGIQWKGSQTEAGTSRTVPHDAVIDGAPADYYNITYVPGTLTVTKSNINVTISGDKIDSVYDGKEHTATYHITGISDPGFKEEYIQFNGSHKETSRTHVGRNELVLAGMFSTVPEQAKNFNVTYNASNGYVSITPATATVHTSSATKVYDGTPLTSHVEGTGENADWVEGLAEGETAVIKHNTGSQTKVGSSENYYDEIIWETASESDYTLRFDMGRLTVTKAKLTITAADQTEEFDGTSKGPKGNTFAGSDLEGRITAKGLAEGDEITSVVLRGSAKNAGEYEGEIIPEEALGQDGAALADNYDIEYIPGNLKITPRTVTITAGSHAFAYDGKEHKLPEYEVQGLAEGDAIEAVITGSIRTPKQSPVTNHVDSYKFTSGDESNYKVVTADGQLTMNKAQAEITITAGSGQWKYDGTEKSNHKVTVTSGELFEGDKLIATASGSVVNVNDTAEGNNPVAEGWRIVHGPDEEDVTENYAVTVEAGTLTVQPRKVTVTAGSEEFTYDGKEHTNNSYEVKGLVKGDEITARTSGSITLPSESPVVNAIISWDMTKGDLSNYNVETADGQLTMVNAQREITISAASSEWTYDGQLHSDSRVSVTHGALFEGDELVAEAEGTVRNVADTKAGNNTVKSGYRILHGKTDVTDSYQITVKAGTLKVTERPVKVTAASEEFTYDGQTHSLPEFEVENIVGDDEIQAVVIGSITWPREKSVENKITGFRFLSGEASNYKVTLVDGLLTMKNAEIPITIEGGSHTWTYDGESHSMHKVKVTEGRLLEGDELIAQATGSVRNVADTEPGNNPVADGYKIMHGDEDVTANYVITTAAGKLSIEKRPVSITAGSGAFTYDGLLHEVPEYEVEGLAGNDKIKATVSGSITFPDQSPVTNKLVSWDFTSGDLNNYSVTTEDGVLTMDKASIGITITASDKTFVYDGLVHEHNEVTVTSGELLTGDVLVAHASGSVINVSESEEGNNPIADGYKIMHDGQDVTSNYRILTKAGTLTIQPKPVTIKAQDKAFVYDGKAKSWDGYDVDGLADGDQIEAVTKGSIKYPKQSPVANTIDTWKFVNGDKDNYTVTTEDGVLTMSRAEAAITIEAASEEWTYDGGVHSNREVTITEGKLMEGDRLVARAAGSVTNVSDTAAGNNPVKDGWKIMHEDENVTDNYAVTVHAGTLTIKPQTVTVTAASEEFTYDGYAHSNPGFEVEGLVGTDHITAQVSGSITYPAQGTVVNKLDSWTMTAGNANNYIVAKADGELTMKNAQQPLTIRAADNNWIYDGAIHEDPSVSVEEGRLFNGDELIAEAGSSVTDVRDTAEGNNNVLAGYKIMHGSEDVTDSYVITAHAGTLTVEPAEVKVTAASRHFTYDGKKHSDPGYDVDGLVGQDKISAVVTGSITTPGQSPVVNRLESWKFTAGKESNYTVVTADGQLTMETSAVPITIRAADQTWVYDGKAHQNKDVTIMAGKLHEGDRLVAEAEGKVRDVSDTSRDNNVIADGYKIMRGDEDVTANYVITAVPGTLTVEPANVTITASSKNFTYDGKPHESGKYTAEGLIEGDEIEAAVSGVITFPSEGAVTNELVSYHFVSGKASNYNVTTVNGRLTMKHAEIPLTITAASQSWTYDGAEHSDSGVEITAGELLEGDVLVAKAGGKVTNVRDTAEGNNEIVSYSIMHGGTDVTDSYKVDTVNGTLTINKKKAEVRAQDKAFVYDGEEKTWPGYDVTGLVGNDAISAKTSGSISYPGSAANVISAWEFTKGDENNYEVTTAGGQLTMTNARGEITITAASGSWTYDGSKHSDSGVALTSGKLFKGDRLVAEAEGSVKNVNDTKTGNNAIKSYKILHGDKDVTDNYAVTEVAGTLTIEPAPVLIRAASEEFTYDGNQHSNAGYDVSGLIGDDEITATVEGSITFPSQTPVANEITGYEFTSGKASNYDVTLDAGKLAMTKAAIEVTIRSSDQTWTYDGQDHAASGVSVVKGELMPGDALSARAIGLVKNVSDTSEGNNPIAPGSRIMHGTEDVTENYVISYEEGTLAVEPAEVSITAGSRNFVYDGTDHTYPVYDVKGLISGDLIEAVIKGTVTYVSQSGTANKVDSYAFTSGKEGNYKVKTTDGELTMDRAEAPITITAASQSWTYDGSKHANHAVKLTSGTLFEGDVLSARATGSVTNAADSIRGNNVIASGYKITNGSEDVTDNYVITTETGDLIIVPAEVTITAGSEEFTYDGGRHENSEYEVAGLIEGDAIEAVTSGSIMYPSEGSVANMIESYTFTAGDPSNYHVTIAAGELTMLNANSPITITAADGTFTYDGAPHSNGDTSITSGRLFPGDELIAETSGSVVNVGDSDFGNNIVSSYRIMHGTEDVTACYDVKTQAGTLQIEPAQVTIRAQDKAFAYDGTAKTWKKYDVSGLVAGDEIEAVIEGSITYPSINAAVNKVVSYIFVNGDENNYTVTTENGRLTMTNAQREITIRSASQEWTYDGDRHTNHKVELAAGALFEGDRLEASADGAVTDVSDTAEGNNTISECRIMHGDENVTANYAITKQEGTLSILPKAAAVTAGSKTFTYDGRAHSDGSYEVTGLVKGDSIEAVVSGSITYPKQSPVVNTLESYQFTKGNADNYTVTTENGALTMKPADAKITITAASGEWTYDGAAHTDSSVSITAGELFKGDRLVAAATGTVTNVRDSGEGNNAVAEGYKIMHGDEDVSDSYEITTQPGTLTVKPKAVTITAADHVFTYDGSEHSYPQYDVDGLVGDDSIDAVVTGTITLPGQSPVVNKIDSWDFRNGEKSNYRVKTRDGRLTMNTAARAITIKAADGTWTYDGKAHADGKVTITDGELFAGDRLVAAAEGTVTDVADTKTGNNRIAEGYAIMHGDEDVTANYVITAASGTLTVKPAKVTVTAASHEYTYNGKTHKDNTYTTEGLIGTDAIEAVVSGSITYPQQSPAVNKLESYQFTSGNEGNYTVKTVDGELTMNAAASPLTITAASQEWTYDGQAHADGEVTITSGKLFDGDELVTRVKGSVTNVADTAAGNNVIKSYQIIHDGVDVTGNYDVQTVNGQLTINKKAVTVKAQDKAFIYDGEAKSWDGYDVYGLVGEDEITAETSGEITYPKQGPVANKIASWDFTKGDPNNYQVTEKSGELTMNRGEAEITITSASKTWTFDGKAHEAGEVKVTEGKLFKGDRLEAAAGGSVTDVADTTGGNNTITSFRIMHGDEDVTDNYAITAQAGTLTIEPAAVTIKASDAKFTYDGREHRSADYEVTGLIGDDAIEAVIEGVIVFPSQSPVRNKVVSYTFTSGTPGNYMVETEAGKLTMDKAKAAITISAANETFTFDGSQHSAPDVTVTAGELLHGDELVAAAEGSVRNTADTKKGNNPVAEGYKILHGDVDVTDNYEIEVRNGTLTVKPAALTITAGSDSFVYDGEKHRCGAYEVEGLVKGDALTAGTKGSITFPSEKSVRNVIDTYEFTAGDERNYKIETVDGTLTMTRADRQIGIEAASRSWTYDGETHTAGKVKVSEGELFTGDELVASADGTATNVSDTKAGNNPVADGYKIMHGDVDVTENYVITPKAGKLTILPADVIIKARDAEFVYDGNAHSESGYDVEGLVKGDEISAVITGSITYPDKGSVKNVVESYEFVTGDPNNYSVTVINGTLTMKKAEIAITLTGASDKFVYDGTHHKNPEVTVSKGRLVKGDELVAEAYGSVRYVGDTASGNNPVAETYRIMNRGEDVTANYTINTEAGSLAVEPRKLTIKAKDALFDYDGQAHSEPHYDVEGLVAGDAVEVIVQGSISHPDQNPVPNRITGYRFTSGDEANYKVTTKDGVLRMNPVPIHNLIIHYVDKKNKKLADDYTGSFEEDTAYGPIDSPKVKGYTPEYGSIYGTMGRTDIEIYVVYKKNPVPAGPDEPDRSQPPQPPAGQVTTGDDGAPVITDLPEDEIPLVTANGAWALINLLSMILTAIISLLLLIFIFIGRKRKDEDGDQAENTDNADNAEEGDRTEKKVKRRWFIRLLGIIPAAAAVILFLLTEDMSQPMVVYDKWTIAMIFILFVDLIVVIAARNKEEDDEDEQQETTA